MTQPIRILYVDDYPLDRELVRDALEEEAAGFHVTEAASRQEFEQRLAEGNYDLVLSDFNILGFEGLDVLDAVHAKDPSVPVVIVTGTGSEEIAVQAMKRGAADYVIKSPDHIRRLPLTIRAVLEKQRLREEQIQANEALEDSRRRLQALFDHAQDAILLANDDAEYVDANPAACELLGYTREELLNLHLADITPDVEYAKALDLWSDFIAAGEQRGEFKLLRSDGQIVTTEYRAVANIVPGVHLSVLRDITERKRMEEELRKSEELHRVTLSNISEAVFVTDNAGHFTYVCPNVDVIFGYSSAEVGALGNIAELLGDGLFNRRELEAAGEIRNIERTVTDKAGRRRSLLVSVKQVSISNGTVLYTCRDITDRKRAEEALRDREARLVKAQQVAHMGFLDWDLKTAELFCSDEVYRMYGVSQEEAPSAPEFVAKVVHPDDLEYVQRHLDLAARGVKRLDIDHRVKRPDGEVLWVHAQAELVYDVDGNPKTLLGTVVEITKRKRAEEALAESEERFRGLAQSATDAIITIGQDGCIRFFNQAAERIFGYPRQEVVGEDVTRLMPEMYQTAHSAGMRRYLKTGEASILGRTVELEGRRKSGDIFPLELSLSTVQVGGEVTFTSIIRDITKRKQAQEALRESEEKYRHLFENMNEGLVIDKLIYDGQGAAVDWVIQDVNPAYEDILGISRDQAVGKKASDVYAQHETIKPYLELFTEVTRTGNPRRFEVPMPTSDRHLLSSAFQLDKDRLAVLFSDMTEQKRTEEEIKQRNRELETLLDVSRQLASRLDLGQLLDTIANSILDTLPAAEASSLWLYDGKQDQLIVRAWAGHDDEAMSGLAVAPDTSLVGLIYQTREPHIVDDVAEEPAFERLGRPAIDAVRSVVGVPLQHEDQVIGALFADNYSRIRAFDRNDLRLLQSLAGQAVIAIDNARLFEQVHAGRERLQDLSERLVEVQERERRHIARELHDEVGQLLTSLDLTLDIVRRQPRDAVESVLDEADTLVAVLTQQVRELSLDLRPAMLDDLGLLPALIWHLDRYSDHTQTEVDFKHTGISERRFPSNVETVAYRIVQEALTNVARHANVDRVVVRAWADDEALNLQVEDEGMGFDVDAVLDARDTIGIASMQERAVLVGGDLIIDSAPGAGTSIVATLPLEGFIERRQSRRS